MTSFLDEYAVQREKGPIVKIGGKADMAKGVAGVLTNIRVHEFDSGDEQLVYDIKQEDGSLVTVPCNMAMQGLIEGRDVGSIVSITYKGDETSKKSGRSYATFDVRVISPDAVPPAKLAEARTKFPQFGRIAPLAVTPKARRADKEAAKAAAADAYSGIVEDIDLNAEDDDLPF